MQDNQLSLQEARAMHNQSCLLTMLNLSTLEERCRDELEHACLVDPTNIRFSFELLRRATSRDNQGARETWQRCFDEVLRSWLHRHPRTEEACRLGSEEGYLAQTFECFWRTVADSQLQTSTSLPTVLRYLQACLNGVLLDALRSKTRPQVIPLQEFAGTAGQPGGDLAGALKLWESMQGLFPDACEQRVAYLLFHCHLSHEEMFCFAPQECGDVQEIRHLQREILQRILHHPDFVL